MSPGGKYFLEYTFVHENLCICFMHLHFLKVNTAIFVMPLKLMLELLISFTETAALCDCGFKLMSKSVQTVLVIPSHMLPSQRKVATLVKVNFLAQCDGSCL